MIRDELDQARAAFEEALDVQDQLPNLLWAAQTRISLAQLLVETGHAAEAEKKARQALAHLEQSPAVLDVSAAYVVLARSLLAQGAVEQAGEAISQARQHLGAVDSMFYEIPLEITAARIGAARGDLDENFEKLDKLLGTLALPLAYQLEIRLALGEIYPAGRGVDNLRIAAREAGRKGYELIRRKALEAGAGPTP